MMTIKSRVTAGFFLSALFLTLASVAQAETQPAKKQKVIYAKEAKLDFEGAAIDGELKSPGEFYFQGRKDEKFDSLVKKRENFHREMLRDVVLSR
jgi:hypothetical protein